MNTQEPQFRNTPRREKFANNIIEQMKTGKGYAADAYFKAGYEPKTRAVAKANACRLKKHPEVKKEIKKMQDCLKEFAPVEERAAIIATLALKNKDPRIALEANREIAKLQDEYPDKKIKIGTIEEQKEVFD